MKIALLFRSYGPYHLARLRAARENNSILALEYSDTDADYGWDAREEKRALGVITLSSSSKDDEVPQPRTHTLARELTQFAPDAVAIPGYSEEFALSALRTCRELKIPAILMSDSHDGTARRNIVRSAVKKQLVPLYQSALVAGSPHARYLVGLGFPAEKIAMGYDVVDNQHFDQFATDAKDQVPASPRYFLCCARLIEKKNLNVLIAAFARYRQLMPANSWDLIIAGEGPMRDKLERQRTALSVATNIHLIGHKSYDELPSLYRAASAFVLPSAADEWGLVVNEAMAAGLPVLVSRRAGCSTDLVRNGVNGFTFDPENIEALAELMARMAMAANRDAMGRASHRIIADWNIDRFAAGLTEAAEMARRSHPRRRYVIGAALAAALSHRA